MSKAYVIFMDRSTPVWPRRPKAAAVVFSLAAAREEVKRRNKASRFHYWYEAVPILEQNNDRTGKNPVRAPEPSQEQG